MEQMQSTVMQINPEELQEFTEISLKSWKGDYLIRPDTPQGVTTGEKGIESSWIIETNPDGTIMLKSWKGDYLHRPDQPSGVTTWNTGIGNEWTIETKSFYYIPDWSTKSFPKNPTSVTDDDSPVSLNIPNAIYVADPFLFYEKDTWYMFFEVGYNNPYITDIGLAKSEDGINWNYDKIVLHTGSHLAFPNVFKYNGNYYMVPDIDQPHIDLYQAKQFPYDWEKVSTLVSAVGNTKFGDTTIIPYNDMFWMFASNSEHCYLYYSNNLTSGWIEHPSNPIVQDKTKVRLGGRGVFYNNGDLVRIVQNAESCYGSSVSAYLVTKLNIDEYDEELLRKDIIGSDKSKWHQKGMHTFNPWWDDKSKRWLIAVDGYNGSSTDWKIAIYKSE
jgi:hypothetical protein